MGTAVPTGILNHTQRVKRVYKSILRNLESWYFRREVFRYRAVMMRAEFDRNRHAKENDALKLVANAERELFEKECIMPSHFMQSPGGSDYERYVTPPDWVLDYWHPLEKAQYPDYFARRECRKREYVKMYDETYRKP